MWLKSVIFVSYLFLLVSLNAFSHAYLSLWLSYYLLYYVFYRYHIIHVPFNVGFLSSICHHWIFLIFVIFTDKTTQAAEIAIIWNVIFCDHVLFFIICVSFLWSIINIRPGMNCRIVLNLIYVLVRILI